MLTQVQKQWAEALRSGKYQQGRKQLKSREGHCCLGVLCELAVKAGVIRSFIGERGVLPKTVQKWARLQSWDGGYKSRADKSLSNDNDEGLAFSEIAALIESEPEGLFIPKKTRKPAEASHAS